MTDQQLETIQSLDRLDANDTVELGEWFLLNKTPSNLYFLTDRYGQEVEILNEAGQVLVCSDSFESNLVIFKSVCKEYRVLNKHLGDVVLPISQTDAMSLIQGRVMEQQILIGAARDKIQEIIALISMSGAAQSSSTAVIVATKNALMEQSTALKEVHAKNIDGLNKEIKTHVELLHEVTKYYALPATIGMSDLGKTKEIIDEKLHELNLYGGLDEVECDINVGAVAGEHLPIHIYQNVKHMDVEAIIGYEQGGLGLSSIATFNEWLTDPVNRNRILPDLKCIVAIKTRKYPDFTVAAFAPDTKTYLYLRNGDNIRSLSTDLSINGTLLATESDVVNDVYVKRHRTSNNPEKNFLYLSKHEYDTLLANTETYKPLWLDLLLSAYKEKLRYLQEAVEYVKHRQQVLGDTSHSMQRAIIRSHERVPARYIAHSAQEFNEALAKQAIAIDEVKENIETIKAAIVNGFSETGFDMPRVYESRHIRIEDYECGFIDNAGVSHYMTYSMGAYHEAIVELTGKWAAIKDLYVPNAVHDSAYRTDPFSIKRLLAKYQLMNDDHYFFDELKHIRWNKFKRQNDLAILIQGILDRSSFFGYTKANLFKDGYEDKITLVYDKEKGLYNGDMPDFAAFIKECNQDSLAGDIFVGQQAIWAAKEREKQRDDRLYDTISMPKFLPADKIIKKRDGRIMVIFRWETPRHWGSNASSEYRTHRFECNISHLLNVSRYKQGDCAPFANDPRCRDLYPKWGGLIMAAERYHQEKK